MNHIFIVVELEKRSGGEVSGRRDGRAEKRRRAGGTSEA